MGIIKVDNISFGYEDSTIKKTSSVEENEIFRDASFKTNENDFVIIIGENGSGKTTLLRLLHFELFPNKGKIFFDKYDSSSVDFTEIPKVRRKISMIYQDLKLLADRTVFDNIALPLNIAGMNKEEIKKKVNETAEKTGLTNLLGKKPQKISGGEQQKTAISRAIINNPEILLADEPTANIDPFETREIIKLLFDFASGGGSVIVATHDFSIIKEYSYKRIVQIRDKKLLDVKLI